MTEKRFVIKVNEDTGEFKLETPDGEIAFEPLISAVDSVLGMLLDSIKEEMDAIDSALDIDEYDIAPDNDTDEDDLKKLN